MKSAMRRRKRMIARLLANQIRVAHRVLSQGLPGGDPMRVWARRTLTSARAYKARDTAAAEAVLRDVTEELERRFGRPKG